MTKDEMEILVGLFGASGWAVAVFKIVTDWREDARKSRDEQRKDREDQRKQREEKAKLADQISPFINELNNGEYLYLYKQIKRNSAIKEDGTPLSYEEKKALMNYPGKLEEIGAVLLAGKFARPEVFRYFGEEILACDDAQFLWEGEDLHYWKVFRFLVADMRQEQIVQERQRKSTQSEA